MHLFKTLIQLLTISNEFRCAFLQHFHAFSPNFPSLFRTASHRNVFRVLKFDGCTQTNERLCRDAKNFSIFIQQHLMGFPENFPTGSYWKGKVNVPSARARLESCYDFELSCRNCREKMSIINRIRAVKCHIKLITPIVSYFRCIGDVSQSSDIRIFDLFHTKKLQRERAALR